MNPDFPQNTPDEVEARITAMLLGELTATEEAEVRRAIEQRPELALWHDRLKRTIEFVRETVPQAAELPVEAQTLPRMSEERRRELFAEFSKTARVEAAPPGAARIPWFVPMSIAAVLMGLLTLTGVLSWQEIRGGKSKGLTSTATYAKRGLNAPEERKSGDRIQEKQRGEPSTLSTGRTWALDSGWLRQNADRPAQIGQAFGDDKKDNPSANKQKLAELSRASKPRTEPAAAEAATASAVTPLFEKELYGQYGFGLAPTKDAPVMTAPILPQQDSFFVTPGQPAVVPPGRTYEMWRDGAAREDQLPDLAGAGPAAKYPRQALTFAPVGGLALAEGTDSKNDRLGIEQQVRSLADLDQAAGFRKPLAGEPGQEQLRLPMASSAEEIAQVKSEGKKEQLYNETLVQRQRGAGFGGGGGAVSDSRHQAGPSTRGREGDLERAAEALGEAAKRTTTLESIERVEGGRGRGINLERPPQPQPEVRAEENAFSTFSLNVTDVSFKLATASLEKGALPPPGSVRSEEFINAFNYRDPAPGSGVPIAFAWERAHYPFAHDRELIRFAVQTAARGRETNRPLNLVLLLDNSGSMERADRVRIIREALAVLARQLQPRDRISVVAFARTARLWVDGLTGSEASQLPERVGNLPPEGGTNLEEALNLGYATASRHFISEGVNRVVLLTDGAANLGDVDPGSLKPKVESWRQRGIALDCFGIGWEGFNDDLLEVLSRNAGGRYGFVNRPEDVATDFAAQLAGALQISALDVKVQVEFNPARVRVWRQIGYARHQLAKQDFRDNTVDAAELAAAESGNALYVVQVDPRGTGPIATVRVRYREADSGRYQEHAWPVPFGGPASDLNRAGPSLRLAATAAAFAEWLALSPFAAEVTPDRLLNILQGVPAAFDPDQRPQKLEWMIRQAKSISGK